MTSTSSFCSRGRYSGVTPSPRSLIRISCRRSRATLAEVFFWPRKKERRDILFPSEQALEQARFFVVDEAQRLFFAQVARHHILVGDGHIAVAQVDRRNALGGRLQHG